MIRHYVTTAIRLFFRHKSYTATNVIGLAAGFLTCLLIAFWVRGELSYDRFHGNADTIYRVTNELTIGDTFREAASTMAPLVPAAIERFPEIATATRLRRESAVWCSYEETTIKIPELVYADTMFFNVFSFPLLAGSPESALRTAYSAVLSRETATRLFGDINPLGHMIRLGDGMQCTVTGIVSDCPSNSHFQFDVLVSFQTVAAENPGILEQWGRFGTYSYLNIHAGADPGVLEEKITALMSEHLGSILEARNIQLRLRLQRLSDIHLRSNLESELSENGSIVSVYVFSAIAIIVLMMAGLNFISLTTARSAERRVEVGLRKALGASKRDLVIQCMVEAVIIDGIAMALALVLLKVFHSSYGAVIGVAAGPAGNSSMGFMSAIVFALLVVVLLMELGPAFQLSMFSPARSQQSNALRGRWGMRFRRLIVVLQFTTVTALIIGTLGVHRQIDYVANKDLGMRREGVILLPNLSGIEESAAVALRDEIRTIPGVRSASLTTSLPLDGPFPQTPYTLEGHDDADNQMLVTIAGDAEYINTLGVGVVSGRGFSSDLPTDSTEAVLLNETAASLYGSSDIIGKSLSHSVQDSEGITTSTQRVIGVVQDFHFKSLHGAIEPVIISRVPTFREHPFDRMVIGFEGGSRREILRALEKLWREFNRDAPFDYTFLRDLLASRYDGERRLQALVMGFGGLAIVVGCLGLLGMMSHAAVRRMKEIAIRKTVGAGTANIVSLLLKETVALIVVSVLLAAPIAYWGLQTWLSTFAYSAQGGASLYLIAGVISLLIAVMTTSFHSIQAALRRPVDVLHYE